MSLISVHDGPSTANLVAYIAGIKLAKRAAEEDDPRPAYNMAGMLYLSPSGWLMLSVPSLLVRGIFEATAEPGIELPPSFTRKTLEAHISVMSKDEVDLIGPEKITERGKQYHYSIGRSKTVDSPNWPGVDKVWYLTVHSPGLQSLRRSYGLSSLPHGGEYDFHITYAIKRRGVLGRNDTSKVESSK